MEMNIFLISVQRAHEYLYEVMRANKNYSENVYIYAITYRYNPIIM